MKVAIIDYNAGNVQSVLFALQRLGVEALLTKDPAAIRGAEKVIFPGVGEASTTMDYLRSHQLDQLIRSLRQPVLGVCLGMQLLCEHSEENDTPCIGVFPERVRRFIPQQPAQKVPHMGWNSLDQIEAEGFIDPALQREYVYFVHSYYVELGPHTIARSDYIHPFSAAIQKDNFFATQFHPEKSGSIGERLLRNFLAQ
ncbi:MAG: imidazole glycerol phosphate synthase subunit HisH [Bacteroidota bacterium]